jgi:Concanavalin A-like lectin/glucanases superfamily
MIRQLRTRHGRITNTAPVNWKHSRNQSLIAWYLALPGRTEGGETWGDLVGRHPGTLNSFSSGYGWQDTERPGGYSQIGLDGSSSYISTPTNILTYTCTLSAWVNITNYASANYPEAISATSGCELRLGGSSGKPQFAINTGIATSPNALVNGTWTHITGTFDGSTVKIYTNGIISASASYTYSTGISGQFYIGGRGASLFWPGALDDLSIWNRTLSPPEIYQLYTLSRLGYPGVLNRFDRSGWLGAVAGGIVPWALDYNLSNEFSFLGY